MARFSRHFHGLRLALHPSHPPPASHANHARRVIRNSSTCPTPRVDTYCVYSTSPKTLFPQIECLLATVMQVVVGAPIFSSGIKAVRAPTPKSSGRCKLTLILQVRFNGRANMDTLVSFSSSTAFVYSVIALLANIITNTTVNDDSPEPPPWGEPVFESPAILIALVRALSALDEALV